LLTPARQKRTGMKVPFKSIDPKTGEGEVALIAEETEDLWHAYNLICVGDAIEATTWRRVQRESDTGSKEISERKKVFLKILIDKVEFSPEDGQLRLGGINIGESKWVKSGAHHTIVLELNHKFKLTKTHWDEIALNRIEEASNPAKRAEVAALLITEGLANLVLVTESMMTTPVSINIPIPRKRAVSQKHHDSAMDRFFETVYEAIARYVDFTIVKCLIIAGPGFVKDQFHTALLKMLIQKETPDAKRISENKNKIFLCAASSAHKHALKEVLQDKLVLEQLADTKAAKDVAALETFYKMLTFDPDRATYGYKSVLKANQAQAIDLMMISDSLFRSQKIEERKTYVDLVHNVKENGGLVLIFSSLHVSGTQLDQLTGVAATLRFPIANLDDESESEGSPSDSESSETVSG